MCIRDSGKTNVAIGSAICAACEGKQAVVIQFLKGKKAVSYTHLDVYKRQEVTIA